MTVSQAGAVLRYVFRHPSNQGHRVRAIVRAMTFQVRGRLGMRTLAHVGNEARMWAVLHQAGSSKAVYANPSDHAEMNAWRRILRPGDLFVDGGSNVGTYALWAADCGASVICVEPSTATIHLLEENLNLNPHLGKVEIHKCALADTPGEMMLTKDRSTSNHLLLEGDTGELVPVQTLDQVLGDRIAAGVKLDVEGAERLVLDGAHRALEDGRVMVLQIEWNQMSERVLGEDRSPIVSILQAHGYQFFRPDKSGKLLPTNDFAFSDVDMFAVL